MPWLTNGLVVSSARRPISSATFSAATARDGKARGDGKVGHSRHHEEGRTVDRDQHAFHLIEASLLTSFRRVTRRRSNSGKRLMDASAFSSVM